MIIGAPWIVSEGLIKQFHISTVVEGTMTKLSLNPELLDEKDDPYAIPKKLGIY